MTVLCIVGTRPEAIKMAPVILELAKHPEAVRVVTCVTGQHREMLDPILSLFGIRPEHNLKVMQPDQTLAGLTALLLEGLDRVIGHERPDWVLAQGDTTSVLAASLAAYYRRVAFGHIEAGLRTGDKFGPFPEELNRKIADLAADALFAPTSAAREALVREGCDPARIHVTGNTVIDALQEVGARPFDWSQSQFPEWREGARVVLVTAHRRESFGQPLIEICAAVRELAEQYADRDVHFVCPVHPNPAVDKAVRELLGNLDNVRLTEPLDYLTMVHLMKRASVILTDSGGVQEEAPGLGVPVLVMREATERPEGIATGMALLVGRDRARIVTETSRVLDSGRLTGRVGDVFVGGVNPVVAAVDNHDVQRKAEPQSKPMPNPYGDGRAASRIVAVLLDGPRP